MPTLILMRHAKAVRRPGLEDHARPLAERGRGDAALVAHALRDAHLAPDLILASDSQRTRETLGIVSAIFQPMPAERLDHALYLASDRDILRIIQSAPPCERLMVIGHNPGLAELAIALTGRGSPQLVERLLESFPTSAAAILSFETPLSAAQDRGGRLERVITAKALRPLH